MIRENIIEILLKSKQVSEEQLNKALALQRKRGFL